MIPIILISDSEEKKDNFLQQQCDKLKINKSTSLIFLNKKNQILSIEQVRLIYKLKLLNNALNSDYKIIVIDNLDLARLETQNSLLKIIEEENKRNLFILCARSKEKIIKTLISRSKVIKIVEKKTNPSSFGLDFSKASLSSIFNNVNFTTKEIALMFCDNITNYIRLNPELFDKINSLFNEVIYTRRLIEQNNVNFQMAIDHLLIFIKNCVKD